MGALASESHWPRSPGHRGCMVIDRYRGHTRVTVDAPVWKARGQCSRVQFSDRESAADRGGVARGACGWHCPGGWPTSTVARRTVLYIGRRTRAEERAPLAVAAWHLPDSGPLELLELDVAQAVRVERPDLVGPCGASLLALLRAIAAHAKLDRPDDRLAWITDDDALARRAYEQWGFVGLKPSARPAASTSRTTCGGSSANQAKRETRGRRPGLAPTREARPA